MATIESVLAIQDNISSILTDISASAVKAAEDMHLLEKSSVNELVTSDGIESLEKTRDAAIDAAESMTKLQATAANELVGVEDVNRLDLMAKQVTLMEAKWVDQQNRVARLGKEFDNTIKKFGRGSAEAEKIDSALLQAQIQENRLGLAAVKVAEDFAKQERKAAEVTTRIEEQVSASEKAAHTARDVSNQEENIEHAVIAAADGQNKFASAAQKSHINLLNVYAALQLIKMGAKLVTSALTTADEYTEISARLNMINDGIMTQEQLQYSVYQTARNTRSAYSDIADYVNRIGWNARGLFNNNKSIVNFVELTNKAMKMGSRSAADNAQAFTHVIQGLEVGGLSGQNYSALARSASGQAFLQYVAEGLDVSMGKLQSMAKEGEITAVVIAESLSKAAGSINQDFSKLPVTFGENMTKLGDITMIWIGSLNRSGSFLDQINRRIASFTVWLESEGGQKFFQNMTNAVEFAGSIILPIVDTIGEQVVRLLSFADDPGKQAFFKSMANYAHGAGDVISWVIEKAVDVVDFITTNWSAIEPIVLGIAGAVAFYKTAMLAATAAQWAHNMAWLAFPGTWIVGIVAAIAGVMMAVTYYLITATDEAKRFLEQINELVGRSNKYDEMTLQDGTVARVDKFTGNMTIDGIEHVKPKNEADGWFVENPMTEETKNTPLAELFNNPFENRFTNNADDNVDNNTAALQAELNTELEMLEENVNDLNTTVKQAELNAVSEKPAENVYEYNYDNMSNRFEHKNEEGQKHLEGWLSYAKSLPKPDITAPTFDPNDSQFKIGPYDKSYVYAPQAQAFAVENYDAEAKAYKQSPPLYDLDAESKPQTNIYKFIGAEQSDYTYNPSTIPNDNPIVPFGFEEYSNDGLIDINYGYGEDFNIGTVGRIKESVDISSQDLKYLRDIAEREAINMFTTNTIVPKLEISFGDVRETADVERIYGRITEIVEDELLALAEGVH